jgi:hypothetical protein
VLDSKATLAILAALLLGAAAALLLRPDSAPDDRTTAVVAPASPPVADASAAEVAPYVAARADADTEPSASSTAATDRDAETLRRAVAERLNGRLGSQFVDYLAEQGLSREDAEVVVTRLVNDLTVCAFDALRAQAAEQGAAFDDVLSAVEAAFYVIDGPNVYALIDVRALARREAPCSMNTLQQAGIPQTPLAQLSLDLIRR